MTEGDLKETPYSEIRKGVIAILGANTLLLDSNSLNQTPNLTNSVTYPNPDEFYNLVKSVNHDERFMARIIADAALVKKLPQDSILYLEGLVIEAERISKEKNTTYTQLKEEERVKLAGFLYRLPNERHLTYNEKMNLLYPNIAEQVPKGTENVTWALKIDQRGLRKILICLIESNGLEYPPAKEVDQLWKSKGWEEYIETVKTKVSGSNIPEGKDKGDGKLRLVDTRTLHIPESNLPEGIEYLLTDIRLYLDKTNNLKEILNAAEKILPHRKRLARLSYFEMKSKDFDRQIMIDKVFNNQPLV